MSWNSYENNFDVWSYRAITIATDAPQYVILLVNILEQDDIYMKNKYPHKLNLTIHLQLEIEIFSHQNLDNQNQTWILGFVD